ncbi:hypothetical protein OQA88_4114 [Cercophora sp. LCS_1]
MAHRLFSCITHLISLASLWFWLTTTARAHTVISDETLNLIPSGSGDFNVENGVLLAPILIPRVPGTPGSEAAQKHFVDFFAKNLPKWTVEWHNSTSTTPATGDRQVPFKNLIFRRDPPWTVPGEVSRLTLVAHYDSLYKPEGFIGATDSAASCAILMHVARSVEGALERKWEAMGKGEGLDEEKGVQIILLDGEEAWVTWTDDDSLYGSRALAKDWEETPSEGVSTFSTQLESISLFVLLDLLGAPDPRVPSYFEKTHWAYQHLAAIEERLRRLGVMETEKKTGGFLPDSGKRSYQFTRGFVLDDHVPFMERGVDILHVIPTPFPAVWHTMDDDAAHLDIPTVRDWARIMTAFVAEWMELDGLFLPTKAADEQKPVYSEKSEL